MSKPYLLFLASSYQAPKFLIPHHCYPFYVDPSPIRRLTENRIQKSLARKALYDNIYADISGAATEESAEALRREVRAPQCSLTTRRFKYCDAFFYSSSLPYCHGLIIQQRLNLLRRVALKLAGGDRASHTSSLQLALLGTLMSVALPSWRRLQQLP